MTSRRTRCASSRPNADRLREPASHDRIAQFAPLDANISAGAKTSISEHRQSIEAFHFRLSVGISHHALPTAEGINHIILSVLVSAFLRDSRWAPASLHNILPWYNNLAIILYYGIINLYPMLPRYLEAPVSSDLRKKMVFLGGPRQVGKTTLARELGRRLFSGSFRYLNWDDRDDRRRILSGGVAAEEALILFDEIHKYRQWKNFIKGFYDKNKERHRIIVTGSSRLDVYRKGGDSLLGRYHHYRLHPLSLSEITGKRGKASQPGQPLAFAESSKETQEALVRLLKFGGFPEIFLEGTEKALHRWHNQRLDALVREDIRDIENLRDLSAIELLAQLLPGKVGGLFSLNSLREDVGATHKTIASWVDVLERFYYHFRIRPHQSSLIKSLRKEPKLYLWDWSEVQDDGARFENLLASHLLKFCHLLHDAEGVKAELRFIRDIDGREADFLMTLCGKPWFCVETKSSAARLPKPLMHFKAKLGLALTYQVVREPGVDHIRDGVRVVSADKFLTALA